MAISDTEAFEIMLSIRTKVSQFVGADFDAQLLSALPPDASGSQRLYRYLLMLLNHFKSESGSAVSDTLERLSKYVKTESGQLDTIVVLLTGEEAEQYGLEEVQLVDSHALDELIEELQAIITLLREEGLEVNQ